ncbi:transaldolase family protein [Carboxylicivirga sp. RSCT41]|uniref:transaldolase family protein n=1 Tax=Carboxylicivirga agarovorans TaxID=3417570 RepID=UPI003D33A7DD
MIYLADTANTDELKKLFYYFPLEGVTTNPTIIAQANKPMSVIMHELIEIVQDKMLHVQMISNKAEDILREAKAYKAKYGLGDNYFAKIPVTEEGYKAMPKIKEAGINITATAIFTQQQALVAARAGADWVAPYVNRLDNISSHGIEVVGNIVENIERFGLPTKVLAASFKTVDQVHRVSMMGSQAATINFEILERLRSHPMTDMSVEWFEKDAAGLYDIDF